MKAQQLTLTLYAHDHTTIAFPANVSIRDAAHAYTGPIRNMPAGEQPVNRLFFYGPGALSTPELLAIVTGCTHLADAAHLLATFEGLPGLAQAIHTEIADLDGLGPTSAARIKAAFELGRRLLVAVPADRPQVRSPADIANLLMAEMSLLQQEELRVASLDTRNRVLDLETVYRGSVNSAACRVAEIFRKAIRLNAPCIIILHNHPSGDPTPSPEDVAITKLCVEAGKLLNIDVLDHLIIGCQRYVSLKERGLGF